MSSIGTASWLERFNDINRAVNELPTDTVVGAHEPYDDWVDVEIPGHSFVCRDYVLVKAERMQDIGWRQEDMFVVLCWTEPVGDPPKPEYHAVLGVVFPGDSITWIMDSRFVGVYRMDLPIKPYRWVKKQIPGSLEFEDI